MDRPIILLGTHRSGTTWLGRAFSQAPEIAYWPEPRPVWVYRNWFRPDDVLGEADATEAIRSHICRRFEQYLSRYGAERFCEKTPSNCLRIPFIHAVLQDARFVFILRDGRAVYRSTNEIREGGPAYGRIWQRLIESSLGDYPAHLSRLPWLARKPTGRPLEYWGARPPGWREWLKESPAEVVVAKQWSAMISRALVDFEALPDERKVLIRYEDLTRDPAGIFDKVQEIVGLRNPIPVRDYLVRTADPSRSDKWSQELPQNLLEKLRPFMEPALKQLGYVW